MDEPLKSANQLALLSGEIALVWPNDRECASWAQRYEMATMGFSPIAICSTPGQPDRASLMNVAALKEEEAEAELYLLACQELDLSYVRRLIASCCQTARRDSTNARLMLETSGVVFTRWKRWISPLLADRLEVGTFKLIQGQVVLSLNDPYCPPRKTMEVRHASEHGRAAIL